MTGHNGDHVLVYRLGSLGDAIVALPALRVLRGLLPEAKITLLCNEPNNAKGISMRDVLDGTGVYDEVVEFSLSPSRLVSSLLRLRKRLAAERFTRVFYLAAARDLRKSARDYLFFLCAGYPRMQGLPLRRPDIRCSLEGGASGLYEAEAQRLVRRIRPELKMDLDKDEWWDLRLSCQERAEATTLLKHQGIGRKYIAACAGTRVDTKDWGEVNWLELLERLSLHGLGLDLVMLGSEEEREQANRCLSRWSGGSANLCGVASPRVAASVIEGAVLYIGHDSGPMHLAAAVGTPCVAIFSARNLPGQWFPRGRFNEILYHKTPCFGCQLELCSKHQKKCILSISVDEVVGAVRRCLDRTAHNDVKACKRME